MGVLLATIFCLPALLTLLLCYIGRIYGLNTHIGRINLELSTFSIRIWNIRCQYFSKPKSISTTTKAGSEVSSSCIQIKFHLPRAGNPRWLTLTATNVEQRDDSCHVSVGEVRVKLWVFPYLLRFTGGSWVTVELDDFRLRVYSSEETPGWVESLRSNFITSVFSGEYLRLDDIKTSVMFGGPSGRRVENEEEDGEEKQEPDEGDGSSCNFCVPEDGTKSPETGSEDEIRVSVSAHNWHIRNWESRIYSLVKLDAQLRRNWTEDRGTFVMIAEDCRWTRVQCLVQRADYRKSSFVWQMLQSMVYFPSDVFKVIRDPMCTVDVFAPRADITFDRFRIRDSELVKHAGGEARKIYEQYFC